MVWTVETVSAVDAEIEALPVKLRARLIRLLETVENIGLEALRAPHGQVAEDTAAGARDRQGTYEAGNAMTRLKDLKKRLMEDPEFREEYARADEEYKLIEALVRARTAANLTQEELARRLGTTQSAIARLEGGGVSPSFATLRRYAEATGTRLTVGLVRADS